MSRETAVSVPLYPIKSPNIPAFFLGSMYLSPYILFASVKLGTRTADRGAILFDSLVVASLVRISAVWSTVLKNNNVLSSIAGVVRVSVLTSVFFDAY